MDNFSDASNPESVGVASAIDPFFTATPTDIVTQRLPDGSVIGSRTQFDPKNEPLPPSVAAVAPVKFLKKNL